MQKIARKLSKITLTAVLMPMLLLGTPRNSVSQSSTASPDSVRLSVAEADSLLFVLDTYETDLRLAKLSLAECREFAELDSLLFAQYREENKRMWFDKLLHQPIIWFVLGAITTAHMTK